VKVNLTQAAHVVGDTVAINLQTHKTLKEKYRATPEQMSQQKNWKHQELAAKMNEFAEEEGLLYSSGTAD